MNTCGVVGLRLKFANARCFFCRFFFLLLFLAGILCAVEAQTSLKYQEPPKALIDLVDIRPTPSVEVSPGSGLSGRWLLM